MVWVYEGGAEDHVRGQSKPRYMRMKRGERRLVLVWKTVYMRKTAHSVAGISVAGYEGETYQTFFFDFSDALQ